MSERGSLEHSVRHRPQAFRPRSAQVTFCRILRDPLVGAVLRREGELSCIQDFGLKMGLFMAD